MPHRNTQFSPEPAPTRRAFWIRAAIPLVGTSVIVAAVLVHRATTAPATGVAPATGTSLTTGTAPAPPSDQTAATGGTVCTPTNPAQDVTWTPVAGVRLPASRRHGPWFTENGLAAGYSRSRQGAALAAVQVLLRSSPTSGPRVFLPVLTSQITGTNTAAMRRATTDQYALLRKRADPPDNGLALDDGSVPDGSPIPGTNARVRGYRIVTFNAARGTATVDVVLDSPDLSPTGRLVAFAVNVRWTYDDWRVTAPPRGDWATVATPLRKPPADLRSYDPLGTPGAQ